MNIIKYAGYEGTAELDLELGVCRGKILFIDDLVTYQADTPKAIETAFKEAVDDYVETCKELGRQPQKPLSGVFQVRVGANLHKMARLRATADGVTLNEVVSAALDCYVNGTSHVTNNHSYQHITVADADTFALYTASIATNKAIKGALTSVIH
ncbi:type II toxin-antitoxin system HicB family antitoxin [Stenotrophomonas sp. Y6]|uniref:type II toxin-antitoxin system HicB family antitoxin n=1 Tax=Stenotrophomonas sp. Y6 TaxID=2920383 RepID=UPI001F054E9C|nr:type II toxin-antitoxin system HicB family antitoxin [Stenotrophomonas sp. Y6]MCH1907973.1 type II toxin-antitoxin system HicB family antitoxin [Stenotrophomonas sp. Y6]